MKKISSYENLENKKKLHEIPENVARAIVGGCCWFSNSYTGPIKYNGWKFW